MTKDRNINNLIKETLDSSESIQRVKTPPFFKEKTMQLLFAEKVEQQTVWSWLTPRLQLAILGIIVVLNILAFYQSNINGQEETVNEFAETYDLYSDEESIVFN